MTSEVVLSTGNGTIVLHYTGGECRIEPMLVPGDGIHFDGVDQPIRIDTDDGTSGQVLTSTGSSSTPNWNWPVYDITASYTDAISDGTVIYRQVLPRSAYLQGPNSRGHAGVAPTGNDSVITVYASYAGSPTILNSLGTITFAVGSRVATSNIPTDTILSPGDIVTLTVTSANSIAGVAITIPGNLWN